MRIVYNGKCKSVVQHDSIINGTISYSSLIYYDDVKQISVPYKLELGQIVQVIVTDESELELAENIIRGTLEKEKIPSNIPVSQPVEYPMVGVDASRTVEEFAKKKLDKVS